MFGCHPFDTAAGRSDIFRTPLLNWYITDNLHLLFIVTVVTVVEDVKAVDELRCRRLPLDYHGATGERRARWQALGQPGEMNVLSPDPSMKRQSAG